MDSKEEKKAVIYIFTFMGINAVGIIFLIFINWIIGLVWILVIPGGLGLYLLVKWHAGAFAYRCSNCNSIFKISTSTDFLSPHMMDKKLLKCPSCGESSWCKAIGTSSVKEKVESSAPKVDKVKIRTKSLYAQIGTVVFIYLLLWAYTLLRLPMSFDSLALPTVATVFPLLQGVFWVFAIKHGYRSNVYLLLTVFFVLILISMLLVQIFC